jgi:hypothetical protein
MSDQYRGTIKQSFAWWDVGGADLPSGLFTDFNEKFKAWERRRGFKSEDEVNPDDPEPHQKLRGNALRAKLALESKKRVLAAEAAKQAKKDAKKKLPKAVKPTKFAPDIVGKQYSSNNNAQRKIKDYIMKNYLTIPSDYQFGVNKIDWGCYEITGSRALTPNKKSRKVAAT